MSALVARQPVLDTEKKTWGYELLFRSGVENVFTGANGVVPDGDHATLTVMNNAFFDGIGEITGGRKALVNFTRFLLLNGYAEILSPETVVIEILENIKPDAKVIEACYRLKNLGFTIALDDFRYSPEFDDLISLADIVKVDFTLSGDYERMELADKLLPLGVQLLAEKVETEEEFIQAQAIGYHLFQGYFFSRPQIIQREKIPETKAAKLRLLQEVNKLEIDLEKVEEIFKHDPGMTMRLLRYLNSAAFGLRSRISSIRQAVTLLGQRNLRKWATVMVMADVSTGKPMELLKQAVFRARFCELFAELSRHIPKADDFFLVGLLSLADTMLDSPRDKVFAEMALPQKLLEVLTSVEGTGDELLGDSLRMAENVEKGNWGAVDGLAEHYGIDHDVITKANQEAMAWADNIASQSA